MPAVETGLLSIPVAVGKDFAGASENFSGGPAAGGDFDRVMQATLAPLSQKLTDKKPWRAGKNPPAHGNSFAAAAPATLANQKNSKAGISGEKSDRATGGEQKDVIDAGKTISADSNALPVATDAAEPLPVFLSLPLFLGSTESLPQPEKAGAVKSIFPAEGQTPGKIATAVLPRTLLPIDSNLAASSLAEKAESQAVGTEKDVPPNHFPPTTNDETKSEAVKADAPDNRTAAPIQKEAYCQNAGATPTAAPENSAPKTDTAKIILPVDLPATPAAAPAASQISAVQPDARVGEEKMDWDPAMAMERATENAGTGVATTVMQMKNPQKTNKVAGLDVKVLPVGETSEPREKNLPPQLLVTQARAADNQGGDLNFAFANGNGHAPVAENAPVLNTVDLPPLLDARLRTMERAHDMVALHAMRLVESKSDALSVVIKPAVGTELSLELRRRDGSVEAQATLTRGDHQFLSQHWPDLQQRLEQRGIKLAPLRGEANFPANDGENFQRQQTSQEDAAQQAAAFAEFAAVGSIGGATARLAVAHDGWESWA